MEEIESKEELGEVITFDVEFTGMTEEDFAFLRAWAEEQKQKRL